jgi:hypothetical protein
MKSATSKLVEKVIQRPEAYFVVRKEENYDLFLDLYQEVGYAPTAEDEIAAWKVRSCDTWRLQDSIIPGNCTGGVSAGKVVSAFGALPMTKNALWGHSGCMVKTLDAAVTFFAQALHIIDRIENKQEGNCYIGSYAHKSRLTSLFQRPLSGPIANQLEVEVVGLPFDMGSVSKSGLRLASEPFEQDHLTLIPESARDFLIELSSPNPLFDQIHKAHLLSLKDAENGAVRCLALVQIAPPEVTAANIFSWTWIFPAIHTQVNSQFIQSLRSVPELKPSFLQIALRQRNDFALDDLNVPLRPAFWALTPMEQLSALRVSYRDAFLPVLDMYSTDELSNLGRRLHQ